MVLSVESCGSMAPGGCSSWIPQLANLWRTTGDVQVCVDVRVDACVPCLCGSLESVLFLLCARVCVRERVREPPKNSTFSLPPACPGDVGVDHV